MRLDGKVALITGAGSGMGRVAALMFAREGAQVVAADLDEQAGHETEALARQEGLEVRFTRADVSREADCRAMVAMAEEAFGKLDVLYNNAGIFPEADHSVIDTEEAVWDRVLAVNVKGVYLACKYGIPAMQRAGGGSIVNIASFVALVGCSVPQDAYTASKGAVIALTRSLAVQFAPQGIRTNAICPGPIETPLLTSWLLTDPEAKALRLNRNPTGRFGRPEDIVYLALYLASDESAWTNGAIISADGGITANYF
jgi:NAD(P)-dependent dehydrogenase (short-subunit alcohol dehydrogenase family)